MKSTLPYTLASTAALAALAACGGGASERAEETAAQLEEAAEQSTPAAAQVLDNAADQVITQNSLEPAENVMQKAGNAQVPAPRKPGLKAPEVSDPLPTKDQYQPPITVE